MTIIAFLYEHWFKTIILALFAATPVLAALGGLARVTFKRGK